MRCRSDGLKSVGRGLEKSGLHRCISIRSNAINNVNNTKNQSHMFAKICGAGAYRFHCLVFAKFSNVEWFPEHICLVQRFRKIC